jgi:membrane-associated progesterone receptor component
MEKYVKVGTIKKEVPVTEAESSGEPSESTPRDVDAVKPTEDDKSETAAAVKSDETPSNVEADKD